ncbi:MAG: hypothetical protein GPJ07_08205 [Microcystis aeruginosa G13-07]|nr:hypothetical protein [Microcystis aeruginosa G13-07]
MSNRQIFLIFYLGGIILTIVIGLGIVTTKQGSWFLFVESIIHMGILIFLALKNNSPAFRIYAGERIQTAGYLHTLIGFAVAIGLLAVGEIKIDSPKDLREMLLSIGSALVSSIIGWSVGGEIAYKEDTSVDKVEQAIKKIAEAFQKLEKRQVSTLQDHLQELLEFYQQRNQVLDNRLENLVIRIQENNQSIIGVFKQLNSVIQGESESLQQTLQQFNSSIQTSSESLLYTFNRLNSVIDSQSQSLPQAFNQLGSVIEDQSSSLSYTFNQLSSVIETTSHSLSTNLNGLEAESQKAAGSMSNTAQSVQDLADDLSKILVLIQQLEELIKYVLQQRSKNP